MQKVGNAVLTPKQLEIYEYMLRHKKETGQYAQVKDIQHNFGYKNPSAIQCHLAALLKKGLITKVFRGLYKPKVIHSVR
jgi:repressor LexA